ncbi:hypothetical protein BS47DRAFT_719333, partial [Hydnum rufescens UP504]
LGEDQAYFVSTGNLVTFNGSGPNRARQASSHPHEAVQYGDEVFIPDLGADKVWRLQKDDGKWTVKGFIQQPLGSGPRHIVPLKGKLYTIHEMGNTVTEQVIPPLDDTEPQELLANILLSHQPSLPAVSTMQQNSSSPHPRSITQRPTSMRPIATSRLSPRRLTRSGTPSPSSHSNPSCISSDTSTQACSSSAA